MPAPISSDVEEVTGTLADVTAYDPTPLPTRSEAHLYAQRLAYMRTSSIDRADVHFRDPWRELLSLPFPKHSYNSGVQTVSPLKRLTVDSRPALRHIRLQKPLNGRFARTRSTRRFERWTLKHARCPELLWTASADWDAPVTATASGAVRGWIDLGREALLQSVIYAALTRQVTGAVLGLRVFRASFGRVFALSDRVFAMEDVRTPAKRGADGVPHVLDAEGFADFVRGMKDDTIEERLPYSFSRKDEGTNDAQLHVLSVWTHAAHRLVLDQPRNGRFARLPPVMSEFVTELLSRAETEPPKRPPLSYRPTVKRKNSVSSAGDARTKCKRLDTPEQQRGLNAEAEEPSQPPEQGYDADDEWLDGDGENDHNTSDTESEWSQSEELPSDTDDGPVEMPEAIIDLKSSAALGARYLLTPKGRGPTLYVYAKIIRALDVKVMFLPPADMDRLAGDVEAQITCGRGPAPSCREDNK